MSPSGLATKFLGGSYPIPFDFGTVFFLTRRQTVCVALLAYSVLHLVPYSETTATCLYYAYYLSLGFMYRTCIYHDGRPCHEPCAIVDDNFSFLTPLPHSPSLCLCTRRYCYLAGAACSVVATIVTYLINDDQAGLQCGPCMCIEAAESKEGEGITQGTGVETNSMPS